MSAERQTRLFAIIVAAMAGLCALALFHVAQVVPLHIPLDPNEGWNAYHADAAVQAGVLYPRAPSMMVNNYPPLFFFLDGALGEDIGDTIVAGRILSLIAFVAIACEIALISTRAGAFPLEAAFSVLFFAAALLLYSNYVGMSDPQLVGHALQLPAAVILLKSQRSVAAIACAAFLLVLAFFFKHNLIVLPLALAIWLALEDRRSAPKFAALGLAFLLIGLGAFRLVFGTGLLEQLQSARQYSFAFLLSGFVPWLAWNSAPSIAAIPVLASAWRESFARCCGIYLVMAVITGAMFYGGAGVDSNAMFDAVIALSLVSGFALARFRAPVRRLLIASAWALPLAIKFFAFFDAQWLTADYWARPMKEERQSATSDIAFLRSNSGAALCQMLSLCYWADKPAEADVFNLGQQYATGKRSDADLVALLSGKYFAVIQIDPDGTMALTPRIKAVFDASYRLDHANENDGAFYVRR
ncbi:MAG: hypothetical protein WAW96_19140 [Alphaproteobacteria bacterium]